MDIDNKYIHMYTYIICVYIYFTKSSNFGCANLCSLHAATTRTVCCGFHGIFPYIHTYMHTYIHTPLGNQSAINIIGDYYWSLLNYPI